MVTLELIISNLGLPANFGGDRVEAFKQGAINAFNIMDNERKKLIEKLKELNIGEEEIHKICNTEAGSPPQAVGNQGGKNNPGEDPKGSI